MTEDKGQRGNVVDWLVYPRGEGAFVNSTQGDIGYGEIAELVAVERSSSTSVVVPSLHPASVKEIYGAVGRGPTIIAADLDTTTRNLAVNVLTLLFTSGSTGQPKAVPLTIDNWHAAVTSSALHLGHDESDVWLLAMPLHHVGGLSILFRSSHVGARVRLLEAFDPATFADALSDDVTIASVVPTMLRRVLDHDRRSYEGLKAVLVGGGPIPGGILEEASERGIPALPTYGMTETCAQVATLEPGSDPVYRADLLPGIEARITGEGRIAVRGRQVFNGYLGEPGIGSDGWFVTGDLGEVEGGSVKVIGRADDVIVTGGENVDPGKVEEKIILHPGVSSALVVGVPSAEWGNEVVCLYEGHAAPDELAKHARSTLHAHEVPKRWVRLDRIPMTPLGKPDRNKARGLIGQ